MEGKGIYKAIANAMNDISPIAKEKRNKEQGFQYRGVDDVMNELSPVLAKHRIFIYPEVIANERKERQTKSGSTLLYSILTVKIHFAAEDGSEICATVIGEGMDSGDKASNKAMAVAYKYACLQVFCIPTDDIHDPDSSTPEPSKPINGKNNQTRNNRDSYFKATGGIICTLNPDQMPYFNEKEKDIEMAVFEKARNLQDLKNQHDRLKSELAKRAAAFKPIPFGDGAKTETDFVDDIPEGIIIGEKNLDIF